MEKQLGCPQGLSNLGEGAMPYKTFKVGGKDRILICVAPEDLQDGNLKRKFLYGYEASLFRNGKFVNRVFSGSQKTPVMFEQKGEQLAEIMHLNFGESFYPLYKEKIVCEKDECKRQDKACVFDQDQLSPLGPKEFEREKVIYAKGAGHIQEVTDVDLVQMLNLALRGRKLAVAFFTDLQPRPLLTGPATDFYRHMQSLLQEMKDASCLKVSEN